jgi:hypothetical protein
MRVFHRDEQEARREDAVVPPLEPQPFVTEEGREIERLRAELAAAIKQRENARDYSIALQRAIEHHLRVVAVPPEIAANCPHHARMLNEHLARKEGGGA